eukprot:GHVU01054891.1.p1 GENE.GHVU01054891.1~~GHVU01054891.1.p1  ORF type:complete len:323 (-),score=37.21 GHVU01054891.1:193-1161(-)
MPKALAETRWTCRHDAVAAVKQGYPGFRNCLREMETDPSLKPEDRCKAEGFRRELEEVEMALLTCLWQALLCKFHSVSVAVQSTSIHLNVVVQLYESLVEFVDAQRDRYDYYESQAKELCGHGSYVCRRGVTNAAARAAFRIGTFYEILSRASTCVRDRLEAYTTLSNLWGWLRDVLALSDRELEQATLKVAEFYGTDFDLSSSSEWVLFRGLIQRLINKKERKQTIESFMLNVMIENDLVAAFPNVHTSLSIYKTIMVSNASAERAMSKMKRVKSDLRSTMGHQRFQHLVRMSLESDIMRSIDFNDIIEKFAALKARRGAL